MSRTISYTPSNLHTTLPLRPLGSVLVHMRNGLSIKQTDGAGGLPVSRIETISDGSINQNKVGYAGLTESDAEGYFLEEGDILFSHINSPKHIGKCAIYSEGAGRLVHGMNLLCFRPSEQVHPKYLFHALNSIVFRCQLPQITKHAVNQASVTTTHLKELKLPLPPLAEQQRIAAILDKADALRRKRQQAIDLADQFLRSVFLEMFGSRTDRPNWRKVSFGDVTVLDAPMVDPREDEYLDLLHIGPDRIEKNTGRLLPALTAREERLISKKFLFDDSYVLYSKIRPYLRKVALPSFVGLCSADMYPVKPAKRLMTREYLWQLLLSDEFTQYTETLPGRANIPKLNRVELANFEFLLPPMDVQQRFSAICAQLSKTITCNNNGAEDTEQLFDSLSQRAFSGQL